MSIWVKPLTDNGITGSPEIWPKIFAVDLQNTITNTNTSKNTNTITNTITNANVNKDENNKLASSVDAIAIASKTKIQI